MKMNNYDYRADVMSSISKSLPYFMVGEPISEITLRRSESFIQRDDVYSRIVGRLIGHSDRPVCSLVEDTVRRDPTICVDTLVGQMVIRVT